MASTVITPRQRPTAYDPDWRHQVAMSLRSKDKPYYHPDIEGDPWVVRHLEYLNVLDGREPHELDVDGYEAEQQAYAIFMENSARLRAKDYLEPLLLTEQPMDAIAADTGFSEATVTYYQHIFFNCRGANGSPLAASLTKSALALDTVQTPNARTPLPIVWRAIAANFGYTPLTYIWNWMRPLGKRVSENSTYRDLTRVYLGQQHVLAVTGQTAPIDMNAGLANYIQFERMTFDTAKETPKEEMGALLIALFKLLQPAMAVNAQSGEALTSYVEGAEASATAQRAIDGTPISDMGPLKARVTVNDKLVTALAPLAKQYQEGPTK